MSASSLQNLEIQQNACHDSVMCEDQRTLNEWKIALSQKTRCFFDMFHMLNILFLQSSCVTWPNRRRWGWYITLPLLAFKTLQTAQCFQIPKIFSHALYGGLSVSSALSKRLPYTIILCPHIKMYYQQVYAVLFSKKAEIAEICLFLARVAKSRLLANVPILRWCALPAILKLVCFDIRECFGEKNLLCLESRCMSIHARSSPEKCEILMASSKYC